jgi:cell division inhibitor SulA/protein ImuA
MGLADPAIALSALLARPDIRRGGALAQVASPSISTGFSQLDAELPGGGWPTSSLTELLPQHEGIGELRILGPALAALARAGKRLGWIAPPYLPYAPALDAAGIALEQILIVKTRSARDALWATEQALASAACGTVLVWPGDVKYPALRRLQLAAEKARALTVLFPPPRAHQQASPAALRLALHTVAGGLVVQILKRRGAFCEQPVFLHLDRPYAVDRAAPAKPAARGVDARLCHA